MNKEAYTIKLPVFEGPFDLLFHLIKKAEVDIWSVSIAEITEQYLEYIRSMQELNLEIASEFLVMAATLLRLKSKMLLPRPVREGEGEEEELFLDINSPEDLFQRLEEYRQFKEAAQWLKERERLQKKIFLRSTRGEKMILISRQDSYYTYWEGAEILVEIMRRFCEAAATAAAVPEIPQVEDFAVKDRTAFILRRLKEKGQALPFRDFIRKETLPEIIVTFIALLELTRQKKIHLL
ncbi:MAG TPA: segregation/condensation protein A, partial [Bacillota bacterium]|nr:segregation/condensation protein A [Bacillota bacterium]